MKIIKKFKLSYKKLFFYILTSSLIFSSVISNVNAIQNIELSDDIVSLYNNSYASLKNRVEESGFAPTSLDGGTYSGEFIRDASIQTMVHSIYGDTHLSRRMLKYIISFQNAMNTQYAPHVIPRLSYQDFNNNYFNDVNFGDENLTKYYHEQRDGSMGLYLINMPNNAAATGIIPKDDYINSVSVYLTKTNNSDTVKASIRSNYNDETTTLGSGTYTFGENENGWQRIVFDKPLKVSQGEKYYLYLEATPESGSVVWYGTNMKPSNAQNSFNYDLASFGGFVEAEQYPAFIINESYEMDPNNSFTANTESIGGIYKINYPVESAQEFIPATDTINKVRVYLSKTAVSDSVNVSIRSDVKDASSTLASTTYTFGENESGWQTISFDSQAIVVPGQKYYLVLQATEGSQDVVWFGKNTLTDEASKHDCRTWNYENGNWSRLPYTLNFEIVSATSIKNPNYIAQTIKVRGNKIDSITVDIDSSTADGKLVAQLRKDYRDVTTTIGIAECNINKIGKNEYQLDFPSSITIEEGKEYYVVLTAEETTGEVTWSYSADSLAAYTFNHGTWTKSNGGYDITAYPIVSGSYCEPFIKLGGDIQATQEINALDELITSVGVYVGKNDNARGTLKASLYKGYGDNAQLISTDNIAIEAIPSDGGWIDFEFGLPLGMTQQGEFYYIRLEAKDSPKESIIWYGSQNFDKYNTYVNDTIVEGEASYNAYRSKINAISNVKQVDGNYMFIHAWALYVNKSKNNDEDKLFIDESYDSIAQYSNYWLDNGYFDEDFNLIRNPNLEHSWSSEYLDFYDLLTNCFASQALHEMSIIARQRNDTVNADKWETYADKIATGINQNLVTELDGEKIYAEGYDAKDLELVLGFSWVAFAPIASQWYAMDQEIMNNTYDLYRKYATADYFDIDMLFAAFGIGKYEGIKSDSFIGKGFAWEIMLNAQNGNKKRVEELIQFAYDHTSEDNIYIESWWGKDAVYSDPGNQEHCSWQVYAMSYVFPQLTKTSSEDKLVKKITEASNYKKELYIVNTFENLEQIIKESYILFNNEKTSKRDYDEAIEKIDNAISSLVYKDADYTKVDEAIAKVEQLNKNDYKDFNKVISAVEAVVRGKNITEQDIVDEYARAIEDAISKLEKKEIKTDSNEPVDIEKIQGAPTYDDALIMIYGIITIIGALGLLLIAKKKLN